MSTTTTDHDIDEYARVLADIEHQLADTATEPAEPADSTELLESADPEPVPAADERAGLTRRVKRRAAEHAEAHRLMVLETDTAPFEVTTDKVRSRRKAVEQAAALWRLDRDPRVLAYRDGRVRRLVLGVALVSLTLALAWSTAGVQAFAAEGAAAGSPRWWFAWLAEPFCSLALLMVVTGRAYLTTRGQPLNDKAVDRTEWVFLGLTLGMNAWPHLPGVATDFTVSSLVLHLLGPVVAVAVVRCLPRLLSAFAGLALPGDTAAAPVAARGEGRTEAATTEPHHVLPPQTPAEAGAPASPTAVTRPDPARRTPPVRRSVRTTVREPKRRTVDELREEFRAALAARPAGFDPDNGESIRRTLRCGKKFSVQLRDDYRAGRID